MASITKHKDMWRAHVYVRGIRRSKVLGSKSEAELWAKAVESSLFAPRRLNDALASSSSDGSILATIIPSRVLEAFGRLPYSKSQILEGSVPCKSLVGVYFLISKREVVYVGKSIDVLRRISRHKDEGIIFDSYSLIQCDASELDRIEADYIDALLPKHNAFTPIGITKRSKKKVRCDPALIQAPENH